MTKNKVTIEKFSCMVELDDFLFPIVAFLNWFAWTYSQKIFGFLQLFWMMQDIHFSYSLIRSNKATPLYFQFFAEVTFPDATPAK